MTEHGVCPTEEEMEVEEMTATIAAQAKQIALRESVIGDLETALERVATEKRELLDALKSTLEAFEVFTNIHDGDIVDQARAAIAKAEGK